jgi:signal transduction histidine kinase/ligand-binding sensor domain-containing protein
MRCGNIHARFVGWIVLALAGLFGCGYFATLASAAPDYFVRTWQAEQGLPQNKVTAVVQTRDGYLWAGTYSGLVRFDGMRFTVFDGNNTPELRNSRVTSLFESPDGMLWIGDESGQITQYRDGQFKALAFHPNWAGGRIYDIASDDSGTVWAMNGDGQLARVEDGLVLNPEVGAIAGLVTMTRSAQGVIWVSRDGRVSVLEHDHLRPLLFDSTGYAYPYIPGIGACSDGGLWVSVDEQLRKWKDGRWAKNIGDALWGHGAVTRLLDLRNGMLAVGTPDNGLFLISPDQQAKPRHFNHASGFPSDWVSSLCEDREGNLWVGTGGGGLVLLRPNNIETVSPPDQWQGRAVLSVWPGRDGALWVGTEGAGLYRLKDALWTNFRIEQGILNHYIWSLSDDSLGRLWAGTWGGGLFVQTGDHFDFAPGLTNLTMPIPSLLRGRDGSMWIGTAAGLLHYQEGKTEWFPYGNGQPLHDVRAIAEDSHGTIWFGMAGDGLACLKENQIRQFRTANGLSSDFIECLHLDKEDTLWIGTFGGGLNRFKSGRFAVINRQQGLPNSVIGDIEDDGRGNFWMSSHAGIIQATEAELNRCADGETNKVHCRTYGINDGMPTIECSEGLQPAGCRTQDGRLWFPTSKGLVAVDPSNLETNPLPPPVRIEAMLVDDQPVALAADAARIEIPPGRHRFEFQYTGLSFINPDKVQFKYRLHGLGTGWVNAGTGRTVNFNYIPPGHYSLQVIACNNDGVWNETGASLPFGVQPFFWQTPWFRALAWGAVVVVSGGLVWFAMRRRMLRKLARLEQQRALEHERARIASDMHDDLGAHLTRISMLSESARTDLTNAEQAAVNLNQIYDISHELTRAMDEIVWAVNPRHDTLEGLASYLEIFAQDLLAAAGIRCRLDIPIALPPWRLTSDVRHNLFLALKEALHNVVKHSAATETSIRLTIGTDSFELIIKDDGRGFSPSVRWESPPDGPSRLSAGNGLGNMTHRLAEIHGRCQIQSAPGQGTEVTFTVPLKPFAA